MILFYSIGLYSRLGMNVNSLSGKIRATTTTQAAAGFDVVGIVTLHVSIFFTYVSRAQHIFRILCHIECYYHILYISKVSVFFFYIKGRSSEVNKKGKV